MYNYIIIRNYWNTVDLFVRSVQTRQARAHRTSGDALIDEAKDAVDRRDPASVARSVVIVAGGHTYNSARKLSIPLRLTLIPYCVNITRQEPRWVTSVTLALWPSGQMTAITLAGQGVLSVLLSVS